jgi:CheY-like chemotaxis protein
MPKTNGARPVVLVVDDAPDVRSSLRPMLELHAFLVVEAGTAPHALKTLSTQRVDAVLTDLYMPGDIDGVALCERVAQLPKPRPAVIAMSGAPHLAYRSSLQAARYVGADAALTKPFNADELMHTIHRLIGNGPAVTAGQQATR